MVNDDRAGARCPVGKGDARDCQGRFLVADNRRHGIGSSRALFSNPDREGQASCYAELTTFLKNSRNKLLHFKYPPPFVYLSRLHPRSRLKRIPPHDSADSFSYVDRVRGEYVGAFAGGGSLIRDSDGGLGVHCITETGEAFSMRVSREEGGRWRASLSGPSFQIRESFGSGLEAERQVRRWFRRAFPGHVCDSSCEADPGGSSIENQICRRWS